MKEKTFSGEMQVKEIHDYLQNLYYNEEKSEIDFEVIKGLLWLSCSDTAYVQILNKTIVKINITVDEPDPGLSKYRQYYFISDNGSDFIRMVEGTYLKYFGDWTSALLVKLLHIRATDAKLGAPKAVYLLCHRILENPNCVPFLNSYLSIPSSMILDVEIIKEICIGRLKSSENDYFSFRNLLDRFEPVNERDLFHPSGYKYKVPSNFDYERYL